MSSQTIASVHLPEATSCRISYKPHLLVQTQQTGKKNCKESGKFIDNLFEVIYIHLCWMFSNCKLQCRCANFEAVLK